MLLATNQVYMSGDTAGINEMFNLNAVRYIPAPCLDGETYTDNIAIQVRQLSSVFLRHSDSLFHEMSCFLMSVV